MAKGPKFTQYFIPLIEALRDLGGSASSSEATDAVIERARISEAELAKTNKNGGSNVRNAIAWARMYLVKSGHIDSSSRGVWRLTEKGLREELSGFDALSVFKEVQRSSRSERTAEPSEVIEKVDEKSITGPEETRLLPVLKGLKPRIVYEVDHEFFKEYM